LPYPREYGEQAEGIIHTNDQKGIPTNMVRTINQILYYSNPNRQAFFDSWRSVCLTAGDQICGPVTSSKRSAQTRIAPICIRAGRRHRPIVHGPKELRVKPKQLITMRKPVIAHFTIVTTFAKLCITPPPSTRILKSFGPGSAISRVVCVGPMKVARSFATSFTAKRTLVSLLESQLIPQNLAIFITSGLFRPLFAETRFAWHQLLKLDSILSFPIIRQRPSGLLRCSSIAMSASAVSARNGQAFFLHA